MEDKKDIGKLFENKLNNGKRNPSKTLWEKIDTSLETERRRSKKIFYYWIIGGGITILLGFLLISNNENLLNNTPKQETNIPLVEQSDFVSEEESNGNSVITSTEESLNSENINKEKLSKIETSIEKSNTEELETKENQSINTSKKKKVKFEDEEHIVSKNYYYYNSKDGKQIVTTNKSEIDSLISEGNKIVDSLKTKTKDSIME